MIAHSHPRKTIAQRSRLIVVAAFSFTFPLPRPQLVHDLLDGGQHGQLALGLIQLQPFDGGFQLV